MNFEEWYAQSPTRLCGPTDGDLKRARAWRKAKPDCAQCGGTGWDFGSYDVPGAREGVPCECTKESV